MMKIVLCQINSQYIHSALAPWSLAAAARRYCRLPHLLRVEDANINQPPEEVADRLGISQSYISRLEKRILSRLREQIAGRI